jgi:membrane-bound ClpP family serine protease
LSTTIVASTSSASRDPGIVVEVVVVVEVLVVEVVLVEVVVVLLVVGATVVVVEVVVVLVVVASVSGLVAVVASDEIESDEPSPPVHAAPVIARTNRSAARAAIYSK